MTAARHVCRGAVDTTGMPADTHSPRERDPLALRPAAHRPLMTTETRRRGRRGRGARSIANGADALRDRRDRRWHRAADRAAADRPGSAGNADRDPTPLRLRREGNRRRNLEALTLISSLRRSVMRTVPSLRTAAASPVCSQPAAATVAGPSRGSRSCLRRGAHPTPRGGVTLQSQASAVMPVSYARSPVSWAALPAGAYHSWTVRPAGRVRP